MEMVFGLDRGIQTIEILLPPPKKEMRKKKRIIGMK